MTKAAIRFKNVSKQFTLHHERPRSFQELFLFWRQYRHSEPKQLWVLRGVDFEIAPGQALGIIGANGAGKSTILKLISRIIVPTSGEVEVNGRVGALLELGAGFHPDLTGRENIYLNGSILGLSRGEIRERIDDIIDFSELQRFIDTPVKHYSSGMYLRLGFSVAVFTDPDILLIDEALAVGDQNFQHKCLERIIEMQQDGITICFVSHALGAVRQLCSHALWLEDGEIQAAGDVNDTTAAYLRHAAAEEEAGRGMSDKASEEPEGQAEEEKEPEEPEVKSRWGTGALQILDVASLDAKGRETSVFRVGQPWTLRIHYRAQRRIERPVFGMALHRNDGLHICGPNTHFAGLDIPSVEGEGAVFYHVDHMPLLEGTYFISVSAHNYADTETFDYHDRLYSFKVRQVEEGERYGLLTLDGSWEWDGDIKARPLREETCIEKDSERLSVPE